MSIENCAPDTLGNPKVGSNFVERHDSFSHMGLLRGWRQVKASLAYLTSEEGLVKSRGSGGANFTLEEEVEMRADGGCIWSSSAQGKWKGRR